MAVSIVVTKRKEKMFPKLMQCKSDETVVLVTTILGDGTLRGFTIAVEKDKIGRPLENYNIRDFVDFIGEITMTNAE